LRRQCLHNPLAILRPLLAQDVPPDALANSPVEHDHLGIHRGGRALAHCLYESANVAQQRDGRRFNGRANGIAGHYQVFLTLHGHWLAPARTCTSFPTVPSGVNTPADQMTNSCLSDGKA
jgi:hypothetical protein